MFDVDQPVISKIAGPHFFVTVIVGRIFRIDHDVAVIIRRTRIIAPDVGLGHVMERIIAAGMSILRHASARVLMRCS